MRTREPALLFAAAVGGVLVLLGAAMLFWIAPRQERDWRRIQTLPVLDAAAFAATAAGAEVAVTGRLQGNPTMTRHELVAYRIDEWQVGTATDDEAGSWSLVELRVPPLTLAIDGGRVETASSDVATLSGRLYEFIGAQSGTGAPSAPYRGKSLPEGARRTQGLRNRDTVTVIGRKTADGGVSANGRLLPRWLHAGDRQDLVATEQTNVTALRLMGGLFVLVGIAALGFCAGQRRSSSSR